MESQKSVKFPITLDATMFAPPPFVNPGCCDRLSPPWEQATRVRTTTNRSTASITLCGSGTCGCSLRRRITKSRSNNLWSHWLTRRETPATRTATLFCMLTWSPACWSQRMQTTPFASGTLACREQGWSRCTLVYSNGYADGPFNRLLTSSEAIVHDFHADLMRDQCGRWLHALRTSTSLARLAEALARSL
jgi:hypothetical protein